MTALIAQPLTLEGFLKLPETKPASEYINGEVIQKPMPKGRHSRLQGKLCAVINQAAEQPKIAYAFPELRCSFGGRSIVLDLDDFSVLVLFPQQQPVLYEGNSDLPVLPAIDLTLTANQVFDWLQMNR